MNHLKQLYRHSLSLLTDLYQLTMAYGYWKSGQINQELIASQLSSHDSYQDLLIPYWNQGQLIAELPTLPQIRQRVNEQLAHCPEEIKRFAQPERYPVGLEQSLYDLKQSLIESLKDSLKTNH